MVYFAIMYIHFCVLFVMCLPGICGQASARRRWCSCRTWTPWRSGGERGCCWPWVGNRRGGCEGNALGALCVPRVQRTSSMAAILLAQQVGLAFSAYILLLSVILLFITYFPPILQWLVNEGKELRKGMYLSSHHESNRCFLESGSKHLFFP